MAKIAALTRYVSPLGRDSWTGVTSRINPKSDEGPFATLRCARDAARKARADGFAGNIKIRICGGVYTPDEALQLTAEDGSESATVTWEAWGNGKPILDAGRRLGSWEVLDHKLEGLPSAARGKIWFTRIPKGWLFSRLICDDVFLPRAASEPTDEWRTWPICQLAKLHDKQVVTKSLPRGELKNAILNMMATPYTRWANAMARVVRVDRAKKIIHHDPFPIHRPEKQRDIPWRLDNIVAGLIEPGRWYLDVSRGVLYLWPTGNNDPNTQSIVAPWLSELIRIEGDEKKPVRNLRMKGLSLRHARIADDPVGRGFSANGAALHINNAERCRIEACEFAHLEGNALTAGTYAKRIVINGCSFTDIGGGGIALHGAIGKGEFTCSHNEITDNTVTTVGSVYWHSSGITAGSAYKTRIAHNHVYDVPYIGISVHGGPRHTQFRGWPRRNPEMIALWKKYGSGEPTINSVKQFIPGYNIIEKNLIHNTMKMLDDGAAIYCHAGHHSTVRNNVVYAVESPMGMGLYFDDEEMDSIMTGNLVYRVPDSDALDGHSAVLHLHHNGRNRVINNVFFGRRQVLSIPNGYGGHVLERNVFVWSGEPNWDRAAPDPVKGPGDGRRQDGWIAGPSRAGRNLWWHVDGAPRAKSFLECWQARGYGQDSIAANPKIRIGETLSVGSNSPVSKIGFVPLALDDVGPRK